MNARRPQLTLTDGLAKFARMSRLSAVAVSVLLLWVLTPGLAEFVENAVHLVENGHFAHATPAGDSHPSPGPEHGCTGTFHLCSCCQSPNLVFAQNSAQVPELASRELDALTRHDVVFVAADGIDHPPRV